VEILRAIPESEVVRIVTGQMTTDYEMLAEQGSDWGLRRGALASAEEETRRQFAGAPTGAGFSAPE
jgi:hypothetical protein